jgi:hypothetical protein
MCRLVLPTRSASVQGNSMQHSVGNPGQASRVPRDVVLYQLL